tara:strand:+ start:879 stop:8795 length:7917 start_codon:yes stop_codon:yes gene_type:complete
MAYLDESELRSSIARYSNTKPLPTSRTNLSEALKNVSLKSGSPTTNRNIINNSLGLTQNELFPSYSSATTRKFVEEKAIEDMPYWAKTLTTGPVGGFLNLIQKPLALTTSAMKEGFDLFTGQDASFGDFARQIGDNYTFGRLLHDYDLLQGDGWEKWAARGIGFTGDVLLDPLSLLKPVNAGAKLALQVAKRGTRPVAGQLARNSVLKNVGKKYGDDVLRAYSKTADDLVERGITWETLADDIAYLGSKGVKAVADGDVVGSWTRNAADNGWALKTRATIEGGQDVVADLSDEVVGEITDVIKIGSDVQNFRGGPTLLSAGNLRTVSKAVAKTGMDSSYRLGSDPFSKVLGAGSRLPAGVSRVFAKVDETTGELVESLAEDGAEIAFRGADGQIVNTVDEAASSFRGNFLSVGDAENIKYEWGMSMPFTGAVGRALRLADPVERLSERFIRTGAQYPVGLRLMTSETPYAGRMITGIPQGIRKGVSKVGGAKVGRALLTSAGRMGNLKTDIRESSDSVFRQRGKRVVHASARGDSVSKTVRAKLMQVAAPYLKDVQDLGLDTSDVYYAIGGDADAAARVAAAELAAGAEAGAIVANGKQLFANMRIIANQSSMRSWIGDVENYVPRQLDQKIREALFEGDDALIKNKYSNRVHKKRGKYAPTIDQSRKYVSTDSEEWAEAVAKNAKDNQISLKKAAARLREENRITDEFYGETLRSVDADGNSLSVEKQIADILTRTGADYSLFADDIDTAVQGWIKQVSSRSGEVYTESLLMQEGILIERLAEYSYLPSVEAVSMAKRFTAAQARMAKAGAALSNALADRKKNLPEYDSVALDKNIEELQEVFEQAYKEVQLANEAQEAVWEKFSAAETAYGNHLKNIDEINVAIKKIEEQQELFDDATPGSLFDKAKNLEERRIRLVKRRDRLYAKNIDFAETAYERVASGTAARIYIEEAISAVMGSPETFRAFLRDFGEIDVKNLADELQGSTTWNGPDGQEFNIEQTFAQLDDVLGLADKNSIGVWLGVENSLADPKSLAGAPSNPAVKLDFALQRIDIDSQSASRYLDEFNSLYEKDNPLGATPSPEEVVAAKAKIIEILEERAADSLDSLVVDPSNELRTSLRTYFAGAEFPVPTALVSNADVKDLVKQIDSNLGKEIATIETQLDELAKIGDDTGEPIRLNLFWNGKPHTISVKDYVFLKESRNGIDPLWNSGNIPGPVNRISIDQILEKGVPTDLPSGQALGSNEGGLYDLQGQKFYVKRYGSADDPFNGKVDAIERANGEAIANALYRELGLAAPDSYVSRASEGGIWHVAPFMENLDTAKNINASNVEPTLWTDQFGRTRVTSAAEVPVGVNSSNMGQQLFRGFMADVLLANWDTVGMGADNVGVRKSVASHSAFVRIDNGAVFYSRAQGLPKTADNSGWDFQDVSEFASFRDPAISPDYAPMLAQGMDSSEQFTGLVAQQLDALLNLRAQYGGMGNFVRRFAPGLSDSEASTFIDFLEVRLKVMADKASKNFFDEGSEDLLKQGYAAKGWDQARIEAAVKAGGDNELLLNHAHGSPLLNLIQRPNSMYMNQSWGDYDFLNTTVAPQTYVGISPSHRILLELPQGAANIKIYGLDIGASEVADAQRIIDIQNSVNPVKATKDFTSFDYLHTANKMPRASIQSDMFSRVAEADPDFFDDVIDSFVSVAQGAKNKQAAAMMKWARDIKKIDLSNLYGANKQILQQFKDLSFAERLQFLAWRKYGRGVDSNNNLIQLEAKNFPGDVPSDEILIDNLTEFFRYKDPNFTSAKGVHRVNGSILSAQEEIFQNIRSVWPDAFKEEKEIAPAFWNLIPSKPTDMPRYTRFLRTFQRSLSSDGYSAMVWFDSKDGAGIGGQTFPNMLLSNPSAAHGADVAMTSQNMGKILAQDTAGKAPLDSRAVKDTPIITAKESSAVSQAKSGKNLVLEPDAIIDFFERQTLSALSPADLEAFPVKADLLEELFQRRATLIENTEMLQTELASTLATWNHSLSNDFRLSTDELTETMDGVKKASGVSKYLPSDAQILAKEAAQKADETVATAKSLKQSLENTEKNIDYAQNILDNLEILFREGPENPNNLNKDLADTIKVLLEADNARLSQAWDDYSVDASDWQNIFDERSASAEPWSYRRIDKMDGIETVLNDFVQSSWKPIGNNLQGPANIVESMLSAEKWVARGGAKGFLKQYDKVHNLLRAYMIAKPGFHGRNFFSAAFMNHLAGMNASSYRKFMRAYWKFQEEEALRLGLPDRASKMRKAMRSRSINPKNVDPSHVQIVREMDQSGSLGSAGGQVASEFMESEVRVSGRRISLSSVNPFNSSNKALQLSRDFGMATETFVRGSLGFDTMLKGGTSEDAFDNIMKFHFDYSDLSDFERNVVKRVVPFYTWTRKNMPLMLEQMLRRPNIFNQYNSFKKEMEQGLEKPEELPDWMIRSGAIQTPFTYEGESMYIAADMPFKSPLELLDPAFSFNSDGLFDRGEKLFRTIASQTTPLVKAPYERIAKQNLWKGYSFDGRYQVVPRAYTMVPGMMDVAKVAGFAKKRSDDTWVMKDYDLHSFAQMLPTLMDARRIFPDEERYEERIVSNWISFAIGAGLRTNTKWEQYRSRQSRQFELRDEQKELRELQGRTL